MEAVAQHLQNIADHELRQARTDYARFIRAPRQPKEDLDRMAQVVPLLGIAPDEVAADIEAWQQYEADQATAATEGEYRASLAGLSNDRQLARSMPCGTTWEATQRQEAMESENAIRMKYEAGFRQSRDAAKRLISLQAAHPFLTW